MKIVDMHCDTVSVLLEKERMGEKVSLLENSGHFDLKRMKTAGYLLQNFALFVDKNNGADPWEEVCALYEIYKRELQINESLIAPVLQYKDIAANQSAGKLSSLLTVEEGAVCKGELSKLHTLYDMGVRMLTLTWNYPNELGYPKSNGLTERGIEFVTEMERLGMIVDVSHLSDAGFYDVLANTRKPFVASHSNARAVLPCVRNMTDDMIRKLSERGGCMGLNFCVDFLTECGRNGGKPDRIDILEAVLHHARHIVDVGGIEVLGLGSDFDGIGLNEALPGVESMEILWETLQKGTPAGAASCGVLSVGQGFTSSELDKIFCENVLRVYCDTLR